jgi:acetolactate decarboxylase
MLYAIRIDGTFPAMKVRSVPRQEKPYPRLVDAVAHQRIFEYEQVSGTVVGFFTPAFMDGLNVPGYHLHFISDDRRLGGHVLDYTLGNGTIALDDTPELRMVLPTHGAFYAANLSADLSAEIARVEK